MLKFSGVFRCKDPEATRKYHARKAVEVLAEEELRIAASKKKEECKEVKKEVTKLKVPKSERMINDAIGYNNVVLWCFSSMEFQCYSAAVLWCCSAMVLQCYGAEVL